MANDIRLRELGMGIDLYDDLMEGWMIPTEAKCLCYRV